MLAEATLGEDDDGGVGKRDAPDADGAGLFGLSPGSRRCRELGEERWVSVLRGQLEDR
jgi:hypothetical protein